MLKVVVCLVAAFAVSAQPARVDTPRAIVSRAIEAMGGEAALKNLSSLQIEAVGHDFFIDQSERPEGPFIVRYVQTSEKRDLAGARSRMESQQRFTQVPDWAGAGLATIVDAEAAASSRGERYGATGGPGAVRDSRRCKGGVRSAANRVAVRDAQARPR